MNAQARIDEARGALAEWDVTGAPGGMDIYSLTSRLTAALEQELDSHQETAEIMRRARGAREAIQEVATTRQGLIETLRAEKGAAVADAAYWKRRAEAAEAKLPPPPGTVIDHKTCGHVNHTTLDGSRHEEMHSAIFGLIAEWSGRMNRAGYSETGLVTREIYKRVVDDLVRAMHPFEVEQ